jgi:uncharacterized cupredoxin-like copper-binding protein
MKRIPFLFIILVAALSATACGTSAPASQASNQPAPTSAPAAQAPSSSGAGTQVTVTLADNTIASSLTTFQAGVPYTFIIKNTGNHAHNFNISTPVSTTGSEDASLASALLAVTQDKLPVGGGTTVSYTFPATSVGAQLEFSCLIKRHYEDGMRLAITITK